nr:alpha/beta hydrolase domain-containing protein [Sphingomonas sp. CDS-1]
MPLVDLHYTQGSFQEGRAFGPAGHFESLTGTAQFAVDPRAADLSGITDLALVPTDAHGLLGFSADFQILRPAAPERRNGRLFLDLPNRGGPRLLRNTNVGLPPPLGTPADATADGWLLQRGYSLVSCGWQHDSPSYPGSLGATIPEALCDGERLRGTITCPLEAFQPVDQIAIGHYGHRHYAVADEATVLLTVRDHVDAPPTIIPRDNWDFVAGETGAPQAVRYIQGFRPGKLYELRYEAIGAVPTGLGLVGVRDFLSFLRFATAADGNPCAGQVEHVYAFGASQPAGVLRVMGHLNLFQDAGGRAVVDGYIAHGAGAFSSEVNWRFGQMSPFGPRTAGFVPPFDCIPPAGGHAPKAVHTNAGPDYWDLYTALTHTSPDGTRDLPMSENVRHFYLAGQPHVRGATADVAGTSGIVHPVNVLDFAPFMRAAVDNLDAWVSADIPFPDSRMPTLASRTLADRAAVSARVEAATGAHAPLHPATPRALSFGPHMDQRIMSHEPVLGEDYAALICDVDADGNDVAGLMHPEVSVPLATYVPWNVQSDISGAPGEGVVLVGAALPFARTPADKGDDVRPAIAERYSSKEVYLQRIRDSVLALAADRMILDEDIDRMVATASHRWDILYAPSMETA